MKELRNKSIKSALAVWLVFLVLAVLLAVIMWTVLNTGKLLAGPVDIATLPQGEWDDAYVYFDVEYPVGSYAYTATGDQHTVLSCDYLVLAPGEESFLTLRISNSQMAGYDDRFYAIATGVAPSVRITGSLQAMDSGTRALQREAVRALGQGGDAGLEYVLLVNKLGGAPYGVHYALLVLLALLVALPAINFVLACVGFRQRALQQYFAQTGRPAKARADFEAWRPNAKPIGKRVWLGPELLLWQKGGGTRVVDMKNVVWAYSHTKSNPGATDEWALILKDSNRGITAIPMTQIETQTALAFILKNCPWVAIGYNIETESRYTASPTLMEEYAAEQRAPKNEEDLEDDAAFGEDW